MLKNNAIILLLSVSLIVNSELKAETKHQDHFRHQIILAESNHRYDIAETALEHWLSIDGNDPEALYFQAHINILKGDIETAKKQVSGLEKSHPTYSGLKKLKTLLEASSTKKIQLQQAHFLAGNQRIKEAITLYEELFPHGMPTAAIEIEYLNLVSKRSNADFNKVKKILQERNAQYPDNPEYKLALANTITQKTPNDKESITTFKQLSDSEHFKGKAAYSWQSALTDVPVNKLTEAEIDDLINSFPNNESVSATAKQLKSALENYNKQINDPGYKAKLQAAKLLKEKNYSLAKKFLLLANKIHPTDPQNFNGLGRISLAQGNYKESLDLFIQGSNLDKSRKNSSEWSSLITTARYWGLIKDAENLASSNEQSAVNSYKAAITQNPKEIFAYLAIAKILAKNNDFEGADSFFAQALKIDKNDREALLGRIYLRANNDKLNEALALVDNLSDQQKKIITDNFDDIKIKLFVADAESALSQHDLKKANEKVSIAKSFKTVDPWLTFRVANILNLLNQKTEAKFIFDQLLANAKPSTDLYFSTALYLDKQDKFLDALNEIDKIDPSQRTPNIISNQRRIWINYQFSHVNDLLKSDRQQAMIHLHEIEPKLENDTDQLINLSNYWLNINEPEQAKRIVDSLKINEKWPLDTKLDYIQLIYNLKEFDKLATVEKSINISSASSDEKNRYHKLMRDYKINRAKQYFAEGKTVEANELYYSLLLDDPIFSAIFEHYVKTGTSISNSNNKSMMADWIEKNKDRLSVADEYSQFQTIKKIQILDQLGQQEEAENAMKEMLADHSNGDQALYTASEIALKIKKWDTAEALSYAALQSNKMPNPTRNANAALLTDNEKKQLYLTDNDNWLAKNVKKNIDQLRDKTDGYVSVFPDYRFGTNTDVIGAAIEGKLPYKNMGHFIFRINPLSLSAGSQDLNAKDFGSSLLRPCYPNCGQHQSTLQATGVGYNIGWMGNHWMADIGRTPENFLVTDVIGGLRIDGDIKSFSWAITAGRRAVRNTVLSYAGLVDPNTGKTWGGARQSGVGFNLGYDNGGPVGIWSNWQYQRITGENIKDNNKLQGQIGLYGNIWRSKNDISNVDLGLNTLFMSYDNNQNEYTFGHGGYFSPKFYASFSVPITTYGRYRDWSYLVRLSGGYSMTQTDNANYYPNDPSLQASAIALGASPVYLGSNSGSVIYGINTTLERRLTTHWSIGARAQLQRSPYYNPSNIGLYIKYDFNEHWSPIATPPKVPMIFTDYMDY